MLGKFVSGSSSSAVIFAALVGCSSSSSGPVNVDAKDASADAAVEDAGRDSSAHDAAGDAPAGSAHVGDGCRKGSDCAGLSSPKCFGVKGDEDSINPTAVCTGSCEKAGAACDGSNGICVGKTCMPACEASTTELTKRCAGKNACVIRPTGLESNVAVGYCLGGCRADADCESGDRCQVETGYCTKTLESLRQAGAPCTSQEECACVAAHDKTGYCSPFCIVGDDTCPSGYTCNIAYTVDSFGGNPKGVAGRCLKSCATPADCPVAGETLVGWQCEEIAGHAKVCTAAPETP